MTLWVRTRAVSALSRLIDIKNAWAIMRDNRFP